MNELVHTSHPMFSTSLYMRAHAQAQAHVAPDVLDVLVHARMRACMHIDMHMHIHISHPMFSTSRLISVASLAMRCTAVSSSSSWTPSVSIMATCEV